MTQPLIEMEKRLKEREDALAKVHQQLQQVEQQKTALLNLGVELQGRVKELQELLAATKEPSVEKS